MAKDTKNFKVSEFTCKCGCGLNIIDQRVMNMAQTIRDALGVPVRVTGVKNITQNQTALKALITLKALPLTYHAQRVRKSCTTLSRGWTRKASYPTLTTASRIGAKILYTSTAAVKGVQNGGNGHDGRLLEQCY